MPPDYSPSKSQDELRRRAISRVRKCLALAESSNPHEAEIALRQARKLMDRYHLDQAECLSSTVEEQELRVATGKRMPPLWVQLLTDVVAKAFGCSLLFARYPRGGVYAVFIGTAGAPEVAQYAYDVLARQLQTGKHKLLGSIPVGGRGVRRKIGARYAEHWVLAVRERVEQFAGMDPDTEQAVGSYLSIHYPDVVPAVPPRRRKLSVAELLAAHAGSHDGRSAALHVPVREDQGEGLLEILPVAPGAAQGS